MGEVSWFFRSFSDAYNYLVNLFTKKKRLTSQKQLDNVRIANRLEKAIRYNERKAKLDRRHNTSRRAR